MGIARQLQPAGALRLCVEGRVELQILLPVGNSNVVEAAHLIQRISGGHQNSCVRPPATDFLGSAIGKEVVRTGVAHEARMAVEAG